MKKLFKLFFVSFVLTINVYANENHIHDAGYSEVKISADKTYQGDVNVSVTGLVCDFCARALEKVFGREEAVSNIVVDMDEGMVKVSLKTGQSMSEEKMIQLITESGYNVESIHQEN